MLGIGKIALILGLILFLPRRWTKIGYAMLISSGALAIIYGMDMSRLPEIYRKMIPAGFMILAVHLHNTFSGVSSSP